MVMFVAAIVVLVSLTYIFSTGFELNPFEAPSSSSSSSGEFTSTCLSLLFVCSDIYKDQHYQDRNHQHQHHNNDDDDDHGGRRKHHGNDLQVPVAPVGPDYLFDPHLIQFLNLTSYRLAAYVNASLWIDNVHYYERT